ncbi:MAG: HD domain-containing protein [Candidatus Omnitrophota bacterium]
MKIRNEDLSFLAEIYEFCLLKKKNVYIVGGYLRDMFLNRKKENPDIDFCTQKGAIRLGQELSRKLGAGFVVLDREHGCCRLVKKAGDRVYTFDFSDFRDKTLKLDLLHRDFTINTLALDLKDAVGNSQIQKNIIDLYSGIKDIRSRTIRIAHKSTFAEDPLRIMRAFSLAATFSFKIEPKTVTLLKKEKKKLLNVSLERVRDELFKVFESPNAYKYILELDRFKILAFFLPEIEAMRNKYQGPYHHLDIWKHTLESLKQMEGVLVDARKNADIKEYLDQVISLPRRRYTLMKFAALLHDVGKPKAMRRREGKLIFHGHERIGRDMTREIVKRLKLSNDDQSCLEKIVYWHLRPGYLGDTLKPTERAKFRYFRDAAEESLSTLLFSLADQRSTKGPLTKREDSLRHEKVVAALIKECLEKKKEKKSERLLTGNDLIKDLGLEPSPLIGKILRKIEELQAIGKIHTRTEALKRAKKLL